MNSFDIIIIGAGPGGLACARSASQAGLSALVLERKVQVGPKVCAGGITWNGLMRYYSNFKTERDFHKQTVKTSLQSCSIEAEHPIVSTVDRVKLGTYMHKKATDEGAIVLTSQNVVKITDNYILTKNLINKEIKKISFKYLVGADGSSSIVRRFLELPTLHKGIGINFQLSQQCNEMEWHIKPNLFRNGYAWIFPHKKTTSIGAYCPANQLNGVTLKVNCIYWAKQLGYDLNSTKCKAEFINYDYRGLRFGKNNNIFLIGDAAGLASGLTGEGIYPAIVSGSGIIQMIVNHSDNFEQLSALLKKHKNHCKILKYAGLSRLNAKFMSEMMILGYRTKLLNFNSAEMA